ncbi:MAG: RNA polymerase sigma factor RpoD/SigA [Zetaproteobacteria bacterium]|nr:MAG: RNA polymerase sigma factor RpoD/SigA [Zetaproteobacteria bacterium]
MSDDPVACYLREIARLHSLSREEEQALFCADHAPDGAACRRIIEAHLPLVVRIARGCRGPLPLADRIEEGNLGLMHAVHKFSPDYGCRFATYAVWWIRASIERATANQASLVRIPVHIRQAYHAMRRVELALTITLERPPTIEEIAQAMEADVSSLRDLRYLARPHLREEEGDAVREWAGEEPAGGASAPEQEAERHEQQRLLGRWLELLSPRERRVIRARFGLDGGGGRTLEEIGRQLGCTKERVRQIQVAALDKLRRRVVDSQRAGA